MPTKAEILAQSAELQSEIKRLNSEVGRLKTELEIAQQETVTIAEGPPNEAARTALRKVYNQLDEAVNRKAHGALRANAQVILRQAKTFLAETAPEEEG